VSALHQGQSLPLDQVIARIALELQRIAGDDVTYSAATAHEHNGVVYREILYAFRNTAFGVAAGHAAVNLMTQLAQASRGDGDTQTTGWTSGGVRRNLLSWIESRSLLTRIAPGIGALLSKDIGVSNRLLFEIGVPVPDHSVIRIPENMADAAQLAVDAGRILDIPSWSNPWTRTKGLGSV